MSTKRQYTRDYMYHLYIQSQERKQMEAVQSDIQNVWKDVLKANEEGHTSHRTAAFLYKEEHIQRLVQGIQDLFVDSQIVLEEVPTTHDSSLNRTTILIDWK